MEAKSLDIKRVLWFGLSTLILIGLIYLVDFQEFLNAISSAEPLRLLLGLFLGISTVFVFANTWHEFLTKIGAEVRWLKSFRMFMAGQFMNSITPLGQFGGEPFMAYVINKNTDLSYEEAFSTVLSGDIVNGIPTFTFLLGGTIYLTIFSSVEGIIAQTVYAGLLVILIGTPLVYLLWFKTGTIEGFLLRILEFMSNKIGAGEKIVGVVDQKLSELEDAFNSIGEDPRHLIETAGIAHLSFMFQILSLYTILLSLGFDPSFTPLYFIMIVSGLANFAPTPGGSGAYEGTMAFLIGQLIPQIGGEYALAAAILFRLSTYWPGIIIGYLSLLSLEGGERR